MIAQVDIVSHSDIVAGGGHRLDEPPRLKLDLQAIGLALGQHGTNVVVEFPDIFGGMFFQTEECPQVGLKGMQIQKSARVCVRKSDLPPDHIAGQAIVVGEQQNAVRCQSTPPNLHHVLQRSVLSRQ